MSKLKIEGGHYLTGEINISAAKNGAVALIPAAILCDETTTISNIPQVSDIASLEEILTFLQADMKKEEDKLTIDASNIVNKDIPQELSKKLRASYYFMGALLGKFKKVKMYFPGGCSIGARPINLHLKGFEALGATITEEDNHYTIEATELKGNKIYLDVPSVGATINIMLASVKASGQTVIENAAKEPEIVNVATFLNNMGAKIKGAGTSIIKIEGVKYLHSAFHEVIPDRIEAGTYLIIGSLLGKNLVVKNFIPNHLIALISKLKESGVKMEIGEDYIRFIEPGIYQAIHVKTLVYPGYPTDLQQPLIPFLAACHGISTVEETIYENRFQNIPDTVSMGANITVEENRIAKITGPTPLIGKEVTATDLRGGISMVICALIAQGVTIIDKTEHILRGYDHLTEKLKNVGAKIEFI